MSGPMPARLFSDLSQHLKSLERRDIVISLAVLVGVAAALRLYSLDRWSLWLDETIQYDYAVKPLSELYQAMDAFVAPLSLELSRVFFLLGLDQSGAMLRLPSVVLGVATVVIVYFLGKELFCRRVAWLSACVACVMPVLVAYSQEYRPYSLLIFLTAVSAWSLAAAVRTNGAAWWCAFVGSTILNLYTHFVALSALAGLSVFAAAYILLEAYKRRPVKPLILSALLAFGIIGIAYIPALPRLARLIVFEAKLMAGPRPGWDVFRLIYIQYPGFGPWIGGIAAGLAMLGIMWSAFRFPRALLYLVATLGVSAALFFNHHHVVTSPRYASFVMPSFAVAIGAGLAAITFVFQALSSRVSRDLKQVGLVATAVMTVLVMLASASSLPNVYATNQKQLPVDLREGFGYIHDRIQPNDLLLEANVGSRGSPYWFGSYEAYFMRKAVWPKPPTRGIIDDRDFPKQFTKFLQAKRLWVLMTVDDREQTAVRGRANSAFAVQCFRMICVISSQDAERPMLEQMDAFFARFADMSAKSFDIPERAVRAEIEARGR